MIIINPRNSKRKLQQEPSPLHVSSKKLRSKIPRRRQRQISPVLLVSPRYKAARDNHGFPVDSSSGSDFAGGEASCDSNRISAVKGRTNSRSEISSGVECVRGFVILRRRYLIPVANFLKDPLAKLLLILIHCFFDTATKFTKPDSPVKATSIVEEDFSLHHNFSRFEDMDDEESYQMLRKRERRQAFMWNYGESEPVEGKGKKKKK
jgi:hypothetical protein